MCTNVLSVNAGMRGMGDNGSNSRRNIAKSLPSYQDSAKSLKSCLSRQSSSKSLKSSNSSSMLQKKIQEHCFHRNTDEWKKQQTYAERRKKRKIIKKQVDSKKQLKCIRLLYVPAALGLTLGTVMIFGATIRTLSDGTIFWTYREYFYIIGPVVLVAGIIFLLTGIGLENHFTSKLRNAGVLKVCVHIHPDFRRESSDVTSGLELTSVSERERLVRADNGSVDFSLSSFSSENTSFDVQSQWRRAMALQLDDESNTRKSSTASGESVDGITFLALVSTPEIAITEADCVVGDTGKTDNELDVKSCKVTIPLHDISEESLIEV